MGALAEEPWPTMLPTAGKQLEPKHTACRKHPHLSASPCSSRQGGMSSAGDLCCARAAASSGPAPPPSRPAGSAAAAAWPPSALSPQAAPMRLLALLWGGSSWPASPLAAPPCSALADSACSSCEPAASLALLPLPCPRRSCPSSAAARSPLAECASSGSSKAGAPAPASLLALQQLLLLQTLTSSLSPPPPAALSCSAAVSAGCCRQWDATYTGDSSLSWGSPWMLMIFKKRPLYSPRRSKCSTKSATLNTPLMPTNDFRRLQSQAGLPPGTGCPSACCSACKQPRSAVRQGVRSCMERKRELCWRPNRKGWPHPMQTQPPTGAAAPG